MKLSLDYSQPITTVARSLSAAVYVYFQTASYSIWFAHILWTSLYVVLLTWKSKIEPVHVPDTTQKLSRDQKRKFNRRVKSYIQKVKRSSHNCPQPRPNNPTRYFKSPSVNLRDATQKYSKT